MDSQLRRCTGGLFLATLFAWGAMLLPTFVDATEFEYKGPPAFTIEYPDDFVKDPLQPTDVLRVKNPAGVPSFEIQVNDIPKEGADPAGYGKAYAKALEALGTGVKILSQKETKLEDDTPAHETEIEWKWQGQTLLVSLVVVVVKDNKYVALGGHTLGDLDPIREIVESWEFE